MVTVTSLSDSATPSVVFVRVTVMSNGFLIVLTFETSMLISVGYLLMLMTVSTSSAV